MFSPGGERASTALSRCCTLENEDELFGQGRSLAITPPVIPSAPAKPPTRGGLVATSPDVLDEAASPAGKWERARPFDPLGDDLGVRPIHPGQRPDAVGEIVVQRFSIGEFEDRQYGARATRGGGEGHLGMGAEGVAVWAQLDAPAGAVGVHDAAVSKGRAPGAVELGFSTDEPLEDVAARLSAGGYDYTLVAEDFGRSIRVTDPDGVVVQIQEIDPETVRRPQARL